MGSSEHKHKKHKKHKSERREERERERQRSAAYATDGNNADGQLVADYQDPSYGGGECSETVHRPLKLVHKVGGQTTTTASIDNVALGHFPPPPAQHPSAASSSASYHDPMPGSSGGYGMQQQDDHNMVAVSADPHAAYRDYQQQQHNLTQVKSYHHQHATISDMQQQHHHHQQQQHLNTMDAGPSRHLRSHSNSSSMYQHHQQPHHQHQQSQQHLPQLNHSISSAEPAHDSSSYNQVPPHNVPPQELPNNNNMMPIMHQQGEGGAVFGADTVGAVGVVPGGEPLISPGSRKKKKKKKKSSHHHHHSSSSHSQPHSSSTQPSADPSSNHHHHSSSSSSRHKHKHSHSRHKEKKSDRDKERSHKHHKHSKDSHKDRDRDNNSSSGNRLSVDSMHSQSQAYPLNQNQMSQNYMDPSAASYQDPLQSNMYDAGPMPQIPPPMPLGIPPITPQDQDYGSQHGGPPVIDTSGLHSGPGSLGLGSGGHDAMISPSMSHQLQPMNTNAYSPGCGTNSSQYQMPVSMPSAHQATAASAAAAVAAALVPDPLLDSGLLSAVTQPSSVQEEPSERPKKSQMQHMLLHLLKKLQAKDKPGIFQKRVTDDIAPSYSLIIQTPMDFDTIKEKIDANEYRTLTEFIADTNLICDNCVTYNSKDTPYYKAAEELRKHAKTKIFSDESVKKLGKLFPGLTAYELATTPEKILAAQTALQQVTVDQLLPRLPPANIPPVASIPPGAVDVSIGPSLADQLNPLSLGGPSAIQTPPFHTSVSSLVSSSQTTGTSITGRSDTPDDNSSVLSSCREYTPSPVPSSGGERISKRTATPTQRTTPLPPANPLLEEVRQAARAAASRLIAERPNGVHYSILKTVPDCPHPVLSVCGANYERPIELESLVDPPPHPPPNVSLELLNGEIPERFLSISLEPGANANNTTESQNGASSSQSAVAQSKIPPYFKWAKCFNGVSRSDDKGMEEVHKALLETYGDDDVGLQYATSLQNFAHGSEVAARLVDEVFDKITDNAHSGIIGKYRRTGPPTPPAPTPPPPTVGPPSITDPTTAAPAESDTATAGPAAGSESLEPTISNLPNGDHIEANLLPNGE